MPKHTLQYTRKSRRDAVMRHFFHGISVGTSIMRNSDEMKRLFGTL